VVRKGKQEPQLQGKPVPYYEVTGEHPGQAQPVPYDEAIGKHPGQGQAQPVPYDERASEARIGYGLGLPLPWSCPES